METDVFSVALSAGMQLFMLERLVYLFAGVLLGLVLGVVPGLGGLMGLTMLLPFTYDMDTTSALAMLLGLLSVTATSDTIPSVMFGVPGTVAAQATIVDGYPMARQGRAPEALGAAFSASLIGGLFGALVLGISVPVLRPLMLSLATPELLAVIVMGLSLVSVLSGTSPMKGLIMACVGLWMSTIGEDSQTATLRWTFGSIYLYDGMSIVVVALGLFAIPEIATLVLGRVKIARTFQDTSPMAQVAWIRATFRNWFLVLRCSGIGAVLGAMPGVGSAVIDWITYAHARSTEKGAAETFGKGDVRGVIAPESANNANAGGALVPTIAFGIPGGASMAILLGAFVIHGINPGPDMLSKNLDLTYTMVWSVAVANILGATICFLFAGYLARMALVPVHILAPIVLSLVFVGAFQASNSWEDLGLLFLFGLIGLVMKLLGWPRPPLILGFVLGAIAERYAFISVTRYGMDWLSRPIVVVLLLMALFFVLNPLIRHLVRILRARDEDGTRKGFAFQPQLPRMEANTIFLALLLAFFVWVLVSSSGWPYYARYYPTAIGIAGLVFLIMHLLGRHVFAQADTGAGGMDIGNEDVAGVSRRDLAIRSATLVGLLALFLVSAWLVGFMLAMAIFIFAFIKIEGRTGWLAPLAYSLGFFALTYLVLHVGLRLVWPDSVLGGMFPSLTRARWMDIF